MLNNFFKLNDEENCKHFIEQETFVDHFSNSNDLRDAQFRPDRLETVEFKNANFTNVSFSKTTIERVSFRNCTFTDCLFIGTRFVDCRFNRCEFEGCNPFRIEFEDTYIDPSVFEGMLAPKDHSNMGMNLFQQLYDNSVRTNQPEFARTAEFNRSKWKRYVLDYEYHVEEEINAPEYIKEWLPNLLFYIFAGYGIRFRFLAFWICFVIAASVGVNFFMWDSLNIEGKDGLVPEKEFVEVLYYTATIPSGLGDFTPSSDAGKLIFLGEAFLGLIVVTLFATWVVKRALR